MPGSSDLSVYGSGLPIIDFGDGAADFHCGGVVVDMRDQPQDEFAEYALHSGGFIQFSFRHGHGYAPFSMLCCLFQSSITNFRPASVHFRCSRVIFSPLLLMYGTT